LDLFKGFDRKFTVLVADDLPENLALIREILESPQCIVITTKNGKEALEQSFACRPDLVLLDVMMPELDGYEVCRRLKNHRETQLIPVVMITALTDLEDKIRGIEAGADDFLNKPFNLAEFTARIRSLLRLKQITDELENAETVLFSLALGVEAKDPNTIGHCERLSRYSVQLGEKLGLDSTSLRALQRGGILHDIGKLGIPDSILLSPRPLSREEWNVMRQHTLIGERICQPLRSFGEVLPIIRYHHERWDGGGYPDGLRGEEIPITARILQIADVFDALCSQRPYKPSYTLDAVLNQLHNEAQSGWRDPDLTDEFIRLVQEREFEELSADPLRLHMSNVWATELKGLTHPAEEPASHGLPDPVLPRHPAK
jgi:putative two-component system response regulator